MPTTTRQEEEQWMRESRNNKNHSLDAGLWSWLPPLPLVHWLHPPVDQGKQVPPPPYEQRALVLELGLKSGVGWGEGWVGDEVGWWVCEVARQARISITDAR